jgi:hypothetical protein
MLRTAIKLVLIFFLVSAGVHIWYGRLEQELLSSSAPKMVNRSRAAARADLKKGRSRPGSAQQKQADRIAQPAKTVRKSARDFQIIVRRNIFQASLDNAKVEKPPVRQEVVPTALNLTLLGTVTGDRETARAIIVDNVKKQQDIFQIGDAVQGAFIETIERGKVTLDVNGKMEALLMKEREGGGPGPPQVNRPPAANRRRPTPNQAPARYEDGAEEPVTRKPPIRPHRRISFRRDPSQAEEEPPRIEEKLPEEALEDGLPPLE